MSALFNETLARVASKMHDHAVDTVEAPRGERLVLGLDPGLASLGWGIVGLRGHTYRHVAHGCLHTAAGGDDLERVGALALGVRLLLAAHPVTCAAMERWVHYPGSDTTQSHTLGLVMGAIVAECVGAGVSLTSRERAVDWRAGLGLPKTATKTRCQERVRVVLGLAKAAKPQHASDALAVAIVAAGRGR